MNKSFVGKLFLIMLVVVILVVVSSINQEAILPIILLVATIIYMIFFIIQNIIKTVNEEAEEGRQMIKNATDEELKKEFIKCVEYIQCAVDNGDGLKGMGSSYATNRINEQIEHNRKLGRVFGEELVKRGYTVDFSALDGSVQKASSGSKSVIGGAIVGGIIAGGPGAVVGAIHAMDKNNKNK